MKLSRSRWLWPVAVSAGAAALLAHARGYDFICDDAFITFRYARNLAEHGAPVYNLGERVEGYSNFLWMLLAALCTKVGFSPRGIVNVLGTMSALLLFVAWACLWCWVRPGRPGVGVGVAFLLAATAPLAAWTLGGLETPLFAALLLLSVATAVPASKCAGLDWSAVAGLSCVGAALTRPDGVVAGLAVGLLLAGASIRTRPCRRHLAVFAASLGVLVGFYVWRRLYYGDWLPNTFYLKTTGSGGELRRRGLAYLGYAAEDFGWPFVLLCGVALVGPWELIAQRREPAEALTIARVFWSIRLIVAGYLAFILQVGGDFLGMHRLVVPLLPLLLMAIALMLDLVLATLWTWRRAWGAFALAVLIALGGAYAAWHLAWSTETWASRQPERSAQGIEPIWLTKRCVQQWEAMGRWIAQRAAPGDWMAVGAAGAMPYYAGIANLDLLGINDAYIARHGSIISSRPGHQRWSPREYTLAKRPVFLFEASPTWSESRPPRRFPEWEAAGYVGAEARLSPERHAAPRPLFVHFLLRRDRAIALQALHDPDLSLAGLDGP